MFRNIICVLIYHRHKPLDQIHDEKKNARTFLILLRSSLEINTPIYLEFIINCRSQWPRRLRHKLSTLARSIAGIVGSNPAQGMDVCIMCVYSVSVMFCV
jgi:hypothetical protein